MNKDFEALIKCANKVFVDVASPRGDYLLPISFEGQSDLVFYVPLLEFSGNLIEIVDLGFFKSFEYSICGKILVPKVIAEMAEMKTENYRLDNDKFFCFYDNVLDVLR